MPLQFFFIGLQFVHQWLTWQMVKMAQERKRRFSSLQWQPPCRPTCRFHLRNNSEALQSSPKAPGRSKYGWTSGQAFGTTIWPWGLWLEMSTVRRNKEDLSIQIAVRETPRFTALGVKHWSKFDSFSTHRMGKTDVTPVSNIARPLGGFFVFLQSEHAVRQPSSFQQPVHCLAKFFHAGPQFAGPVSDIAQFETYGIVTGRRKKLEIYVMIIF